MKILSFGEVLWDVFENESLIGGAPFNFSAHLAKLGAKSYILTAVGNDNLGKKTLKEIDRIGVKTDFVKTLPYETGKCIVKIKNSTPNYDLVENTAYDHIPLSDEIFNSTYDGVYFGTLAQRNPVSKASLDSLLAKIKTKEIFCDINIRQQYYNDETILNCLRNATILKISREELPVISHEAENIEIIAENISKTYGTKIIIITLDKDGAYIYSGGQGIFSHKPKSKPISTVGAGDSFSACFFYNYLKGEHTETCLKRAVDLSDFVVTKMGAIPDYDRSLFV